MYYLITYFLFNSEAFETYYEKLVDSLPMKNEMFMADLTSLCSDDLKANLVVMLTRSAQAICFLENEIKVPLDDDYIKPFTELLSIMENFDDIQLQMLAQEIQQCIRAIKQKRMPTLEVRCVSGLSYLLRACKQIKLIVVGIMQSL